MMTDDNIKEWVEKETFEKLEKFRISNKVNLSEDSTWCPIPECSAVAKIKGGNMFGEWSECWFRFCLIWKNFYHSGRRWPALSLGKTAFESLSKAEQQQFIQDQLADFYINKYSKNCPKWKVSITKMTGWNKMIWPQCGVYFWWKWMEIIQGYQHFEINPQCWDTTGQSDKVGLTEKDITEVKDNLGDSSVINSVAWPECKKFQKSSIINKRTEQNLLTCEKWGSNVCFYCGKIAEQDHYKTSFWYRVSKLSEVLTMQDVLSNVTKS